MDRRRFISVATTVVVAGPLGATFAPNINMLRGRNVREDQLVLKKLDINRYSSQSITQGKDPVPGVWERCRGLGVEPVPRERAHDLMGEWFEALVRAMPTPRSTTTH